MSTITDLVIKHKAATTERERAEIERDLWDNHSGTEVRAKLSREKWLNQLVGAIGHQSGIRQVLLNAGPSIEPIWARIDGPEKMPLRTAWGQFKNAEEYAADDHVPLVRGVEIALAEYDTWPQWRTSDGKSLYRRRPPNLTRLRRRHKQSTPEGDRKFWSEIKQKINAHIAERMANVDHLTANKIQRDFGARLQILCDEFGGKINATRIRSRHETSVDISVIRFAKVREACAELAIDPPTRNGSVDLAKANKNKNKLAVQYHPDTAPDPDNPPPERLEKYRQVIDAYNTLEAYNQQIKESNTNG